MKKFMFSALLLLQPACDALYAGNGVPVPQAAPAEAGQQGSGEHEIDVLELLATLQLCKNVIVLHEVAMAEPNNEEWFEIIQSKDLPRAQAKLAVNGGANFFEITFLLVLLAEGQEFGDFFRQLSDLFLSNICPVNLTEDGCTKLYLFSQIFDRLQGIDNLVVRNLAYRFSQAILPKIEEANDCAFCSTCFAPSSQRCSQCHTRRYCSKKCQKIDWKAHKKICKAPQLS